MRFEGNSFVVFECTNEIDKVLLSNLLSNASKFSRVLTDINNGFLATLFSSNELEVYWVTMRSAISYFATKYNIDINNPRNGECSLFNRMIDIRYNDRLREFVSTNGTCMNSTPENRYLYQLTELYRKFGSTEELLANCIISYHFNLGDSFYRIELKNSSCALIFFLKDGLFWHRKVLPELLAAQTKLAAQKVQEAQDQEFKIFIGQ